MRTRARARQRARLHCMVTTTRPAAEAAAHTILFEQVQIKQGHPFGRRQGIIVEVAPVQTNGSTNVKVMIQSSRLIINATRDQVMPINNERAWVFDAYDRAVKLGLGHDGEKLDPAEL